MICRLPINLPFVSTRSVGRSEGQAIDVALEDGCVRGTTSETGLQNQLIRVDPRDGSFEVLLTGDDGLHNPASLASAAPLVEGIDDRTVRWDGALAWACYTPPPARSAPP